MKPSFWKPLLILLVLLLPIGCGAGLTSSKGKLSGKVIANGQPVILGNVNLQLPGGTGALSTPLTPDGTFVFTQPVDVGKYPATVTPPAFPGKEAENANFAKTSIIPEKYRSPATSDLQIEVKSGDNSVELELKSL